MNSSIRLLFMAASFLLGGLFLASFTEKIPKTPKFPYKKVGLTERQAAAHLISRFTYGAQPGQVEEVVQMGLEKWFRQQLQAQAASPVLDQKLASYETLHLTNAQIIQTFPQGGQLLKMAIKDGVIDKDAVRKNADNPEEKRIYKQKLATYMRQQGFKPQRALYQELISQKILRATYSQNQLQEVLASFWFNHFNVSLTNKNCAPYLISYERDVIRPNVLGNFETLLLATAKSPAMLTYLDNFKSTTATVALTPAQKKRQQKQRQWLAAQQPDDTAQVQMQETRKERKPRQVQGLNENYAREIMELHTLGVDGGYTQQDVTQGARILTGWTINPAVGRYKAKSNSVALNESKRAEALARQGFVLEGDFLFAANRHDQSPKEVLGTVFPADGGYQEGLALLKLLAHHPATAQFISTKLATRFISDTPPPSLVAKMAKTFSNTDGDIKQVLLTMVEAPEFWAKEALREKTKSPFELAISAVRSLQADVMAPYQLSTWITKMGERMYFYQAPTGFPDKGAYWINTGSLLNRMNFGLALAAQKIPGVSLNLMALNQNREPESAEAALLAYSQFLLPERNLAETIKRLTPSLHYPGFGQKVETASSQHQPMAQATDFEEEEMLPVPPQKRRGKNGARRQKMVQRSPSGEKEQTIGASQNPMLAQVVGIIIGSPEFQRR